MRCSKIMKRQKKEENSMNLLLVLLLSISSVIGAGAIFIYVLRKLFNK